MRSKTKRRTKQKKNTSKRTIQDKKKKRNTKHERSRGETIVNKRMERDKPIKDRKNVKQEMTKTEQSEYATQENDINYEHTRNTQTTNNKKHK